MASNTNLVASGGQSSAELDKKPIWLEWIMGFSGRFKRPGFGSFLSA